MTTLAMAHDDRSATPEHGSVPFSAGTASPRTALPAGACDCHVHLYDSRFPADPAARLRPPDAGVDDLRALQRRIGTQRAQTPALLARLLVDANAAVITNT